MNGLHKFLQLSKNNSACGAVWYFRCLSLALGFRRFDDFKLYSLQRCPPVIPASCDSHPYPVSSHTLRGVPRVTCSVVTGKGMVCRFWDCYKIKACLLSWAFFPFSSLLGPSVWGKPCCDHPSGEAHVVRNWMKPLSTALWVSLEGYSPDPASCGWPHSHWHLGKAWEMWPRTTHLSLSWIPDPQKLWNDIFFKLKKNRDTIDIHYKLINFKYTI